jgi:hypothetical protein
MQFEQYLVSTTTFIKADENCFPNFTKTKENFNNDFDQ